MNKETLNKLKELCERGGKATNVDIVDLRELLALAERPTSPVSQMTDETIIQIAKRELRSEGNLFEGDADEVAVFVRECLAAAAPHAQDNEGEKA